MGRFLGGKSNQYSPFEFPPHLDQDFTELIGFDKTY